MASAEPQFHEATVAESWQETDQLRGVYLEVDNAPRSRHIRNGQIIIAEPKVYLALASVPGDSQFELLVAPSAQSELDFTPGSTLRFQGPFGGFDLEPADSKDVLLFSVGSALAPIKPLIESIRRRRGEFGRVSLYAGAMSEGSFPYRALYRAWERDRIDVIEVVHPRFVQDVFAEEPQELGDDSVAYVCGMPEMMDGVTKVLEAHGLSSDQVYRNW